MMYNTPISSCFSVKLCIQLLKDETKSPVFDKSGKVSSIITNINALIDKGLKGQLKVEAVVSTLQELVVSCNTSK
jgi:hypothetical protein